MHIPLLLSALTAATLAAPLAQTSANPSWQPAQGSVVTCDKESDKIIGFLVGPQMETVLNDACAAMMPPCAYPERLSNDTICPQVLDWNLDGAKTSTQHANVESANDGSKLSGWDVKLSVTPAPQPEGSAGVFWTKNDCYGYFQYIVKEQEPTGCHNSMGSGIGKMTVGGEASLKNTVFEITIVKRE